MGVLYHPHGGRRTVLITSVMSLTVVTFPQEMEIGYGPDMMKTVKTTKAVKGDNGYEGYWAYGVVAQKMGVNAKDVTAIIEGIFELASMEIKMFGHARVASAFILKLKGKKNAPPTRSPIFQDGIFVEAHHSPSFLEIAVQGQALGGRSQTLERLSGRGRRIVRFPHMCVKALATAKFTRQVVHSSYLLSVLPIRDRLETLRYMVTALIEKSGRGFD